MGICFFAADLHGREDRYGKLFQAIKKEKPGAVFLGGDLFPSGFGALASAKATYDDFLKSILADGFARLRKDLGASYPSVFIIMGNDDGRFEEQRMEELHDQGLWFYMHGRCARWKDYAIYGYAYVPPTPFMLKDWERYDVSRYVDPLCISPEEGLLSIEIPKGVLRHETIQNDLEKLVQETDLSHTILLFHTPPYNTGLDRAALDGQKFDYVDLDVHVGSIAVRRFIESRQPLLTLHGHIHESARITGAWRERIGRTFSFSAAHDGPELALVRFNPENLEAATRDLI